MYDECYAMPCMPRGLFEQVLPQYIPTFRARWQDEANENFSWIGDAHLTL